MHWGGVGRIDSLKVKARLSSLSAQEEEFRFSRMSNDNKGSPSPPLLRKQTQRYGTKSSMYFGRIYAVLPSIEATQRRCSFSICVLY